MKFKPLTNSVLLPVLGLGTWGIGGKWEADYSQDSEYIDIIKEAIRLGYTHIDTSENYGSGHAEELVGKAIKYFDRNKLFITSKVSSEHLEYNNVINSAQASLKRLQAKYIDLYLVHAPNHTVPIKRTMQALDYLVQQKMVRFIGVSNFTVEEVKEAQKYTKHKIIANEIEYNLLTRDQKGLYTEKMESEIIPFCQKNNILVIAYRPLAKGNIARINNVPLGIISKKYAKTPAQVALNWLLSKLGIVGVVKSTNLEHLKENLGSLDWDMDAADIERLNQIRGSIK